MSGRFITFEGGEGVGKSTQVARLAERLREAGLEVVATREPGGTPAAETLRNLVLGGAVARFGAEAEALFMAVARADHVDRVIRPALARGAWVISDRFVDSTRVYQGAADGVNEDLIDRLETTATGGLMPDLTIMLDLDAETGVARAGQVGGPDRFERDRLDVHRRRREAFLDIARRHPERCVVVDASGGAHEVAIRVGAIVDERLNPADV